MMKFHLEVSMPTALLSLSDKTGLAELARGLLEAGWALLASGGTARAIQQAGLPVEEVAGYTGSPEILDGRVKTLHPAVHGGLLARSTQADLADLERIGARPIDLAAVNLYPFQSVVARPGATLEEAIENIDIGGVALIRAAAKNYDRVAVLTDPADYAPLLEELRERGGLSAATRCRLAVKAFALTSAYDAAIFTFLSTSQFGGGKTGLQERGSQAGEGRGGSPAQGEPWSLQLYPVETLRYGENPHQEAALYGYRQGTGPLGGQVLQGKALSYNNLLDLDAAWRAAVSFERPTVCIVKHLSPCGIASAESLAEAFRLALASDPLSAFGGVIASNRLFDEQVAASLGELFVECIAAPGFTPGALASLAKRKSLRLLELPGTQLEPLFELRSVNAGLLRQSVDLGDPGNVKWKVVSSRQPGVEEWRDLRFAWKACQHVKSNAIVFAQEEATVGIGGGQPNRVDCVRIAAVRAGSRAQGAVMASDAFFPFPDSVEEAARAGITAVIAPGGSLRDAEAIAAADAAGMAMVFTGVRHFRH
jgi:phosphoribosylaminoimidazolecarboxamide formyltransferase/IMP cyclohydrolase